MGEKIAAEKMTYRTIMLHEFGRQFTIRMSAEHDMPEVICVRRRDASGEDHEVFYEPRAQRGVLAKLFGVARA